MERLRAEDGISLVEVLVALAILSLVFVGTTATVVGSLQLTRSAEAVTVASALATQSMESALAQGFTGNEAEVASPVAAVTETIDDVEYTVTRTVRWVPSSSVTGVCTGTAGAGDTNVLLVEVAVDWAGRVGDDPVTQQTTIAPPVGLYDPNEGQIAVYVSDAQDPAQPVQGVTVASRAPTNVTTNVVTGADGCAIFDGLQAGTYQLSLSRLGYIDIDQRVAPDVTRDVAVAVGGRASAEFRYGEAGEIDVSLVGLFGGQLPADPLQLNLANNLGEYDMGHGGPGTTRIEAWPDEYQAFAGGCDVADPEGEASGAPIWSGDPTRGGFGSATTTGVPGTVTATLGEVGFVWSPDWLLPLFPPQTPRPVTLVAVSQDTCDEAADRRIELGAAQTLVPTNYALPFGTWRFEVYEGGTLIGSSSTAVTASPTDTVRPVATLRRASTCTPTPPTFLGNGDQAGTAGNGSLRLDLRRVDPGDVHVVTVSAPDAASRVPSGWTLLASQEGGAIDAAVLAKADAGDVDMIIPGGQGPVIAQSFAFADLAGLSVQDAWTQADTAPAPLDDVLELTNGVEARYDDSLVLLLATASLVDTTNFLGPPTVSYGTFDAAFGERVDNHHQTTFLETVPAGTLTPWDVDWDKNKDFTTMSAILLVLNPACPS